MADGQEDEDLFADLYDGEDADPEPTAAPSKIEPAPEPVVVMPEQPVAAPSEPTKTEAMTPDFNDNGGFNGDGQNVGGLNTFQSGGFPAQQNAFGNGNGGAQQRPIGSKEDGYV
nr:hypothetical protein CFP56_71466 [Quercus suber]